MGGGSGVRRCIPLGSDASLVPSLKRANEEKEQKLATLEEARAAVGKEAADLRSSLQEVERSRLEARRELQELRRQVCVCVHGVEGGTGGRGWKEQALRH